ncbi:hypothetical protein [[Clostridium] colinum]|uniref:hypothetical protein n=1 Tax=[Clostridium] colinum TaxID=36835 RepID=UPI0020241FD5|nr:hypothetical protein [[Clostridium] colinum]
MLLYFSSEKNVDIFDKQAQELGIHIDLVLERDFTGYIESNKTKLNHLEFLAIDLENIIDDEIELIKSLCAFRLCNSSVNIIIVGIGKEKGDSILGRFFAEGIYNFITSKDEEIRDLEIKSCFEKTNNYANTLGYRVENFEIQKTTDKKGFFNNFLNNIKKPKNEKVYKKDSMAKAKKEKTKGNISKALQQQTIKEQHLMEENIAKDLKEKEQYLNSMDLKEDETKITSLVQKIEKSKKCNNIYKDFDNEINSIFENSFDRFKQEKRRLKMEIDTLKDDVFLFYYYQKPVGIIFENVCIVDSLYEKEDIKKFFLLKNIEVNFKDNILVKIKELLLQAN